MQKNVVVAVAWPYVNGDLHIGHLAGYLLPADICARYNRLIGNNVLMVSGSDCFGTPITVEADKRKVTPKEIVDQYHEKDVALFKDTLHLTYDLYTKTDTPNHIEVVQDFFLRLLKAGYIFVDETEQYYSPTENRFLPDRYVVGECPNCHFKDARSDQCDNCGKVLNQGELITPRSNITGSPVELKKTKHYFLDWPKLQPQIEKFVESTGNNWKDWVLKGTQGWLKEGLRPRAITRDIDWGVPVPADRMPADMVIEGIENKRLYVWFDAVIGYLSASILWAKDVAHEPDAWKKFWYEDQSELEIKHYYFMGQDNLIFHTVFWPGKLMVYDPKIHLPDVPSINMFLDLNGQKFSKSRGVVVDSKEFVEKYGNDRARFYLTYIMPENHTASFSWDDFKEKVNGVLVANLGNFIHRSLSLAKDYEKTDYGIEDEVVAKVSDAFVKAHAHLDKCEFRSYLDTILSLSSYGNSVVDREKLWELKKTNKERFNQTINQLYFIIIALGYLMMPLLFDGSSKLFENIGLDTPTKWPDEKTETDFIKTLVSKISLTHDLLPLFGKIDTL